MKNKLTLLIYLAISLGIFFTVALLFRISLEIFLFLFGN